MTVYQKSAWYDVEVRGSRRMRMLACAITILCILFFGFTYWSPENSIPSWSGSQDTSDNDDVLDGSPAEHGITLPVMKKVDGRVDVCGPDQVAVAAAHYEGIRKKYDHLKDDKFTIVLQTYKRPDPLKKTLEALLEEPVPSLEEIVVVWNNLEEQPPANYQSKHNIPVTYRASVKNTLNNKFLADPMYKTQAILLSDDDVYFHPADLEFVFQTWRKYGRNRLTGALARCTVIDPATKLWTYDFCHPQRDNYDMVLTNLVFTHIGFMDYYSSDDPVMTQIRDYADECHNCDDLAYNFVAASLTGEGPLQVTGRDMYVNLDPPGGISKNPNHLEIRNKCLNDYAEMFHCMPLVNETGVVHRGVQPF